MLFRSGSTEVPEGAFTDVNRAKYTSEDIRFTYKAPYIYAHVLDWPSDNRVCIHSLKKDSRYFLGHIESVEVLGFNNQVMFDRTDEGMEIEVEGIISTAYPVCLKIRID